VSEIRQLRGLLILDWHESFDPAVGPVCGRFLFFGGNLSIRKVMDTNSLLFPEGELAIEKVGAPAFTGVSTGERLLSQRPDLYRITVQLLGQGTGIREIKRLTGLHHRTIEAVQLREGATIDTHRKELGARALKVAAMGVELLEERISSGDIKAGELTMAVGILIDKGQVLTGGVTARVEKIEQAQVAAGLERILDELPVIDAELVDDGSEISLGSENLDPIAAADPGPAVSVVCEIEPAEINIQTASTDPLSDDCDGFYSVDGLSATLSATDSAPSGGSPSLVVLAAGSLETAPAAGQPKEGGRGSKVGSLSKSATDQASENFIAMPLSQNGSAPPSEKKKRAAKTKKTNL